jgi:hypothetical protein
MFPMFCLMSTYEPSQVLGCPRRTQGIAQSLPRHWVRKDLGVYLSYEIFKNYLGGSIKST